MLVIGMTPVNVGTRRWGRFDASIYTPRDSGTFSEAFDASVEMMPDGVFLKYHYNYMIVKKHVM